MGVLSTWEVESARSVENWPALDRAMFQDDLKIWRSDRSLQSLVEILDTGILLNDKGLVFEAAGPLIGRLDELNPNVAQAVKNAFREPVEIEKQRLRFARLEQNRNYVFSTIRMLKGRIREYPRDVVSLLELARLHVGMGQIQSAERYLRRAVILSPNNRAVIRAAVLFYSLAGDVSQALPIIWKSDIAKYDPLIQSAEVAASDLSHRGSKFAGAALRRFKGVRRVAKVQSELALAVATLELHSGVADRRVFQMVSAGLPEGTENAQAQAVWLGEQTSRSLRDRYPGVEFADDAFEARAFTLFDQERYAEAVVQARLWLLDQPYQTPPLALICTVYSIYLQEAEVALPFARRAIELHPSDWTMQNAALLAYSQARRFVEAGSALKQLEKLATTPAIKAYASAGAGILAFSYGDLPLGHASYLQAIQDAKAAKRPDLVFSAVAFCLWGEARSGAVTLEAFHRAAQKIEASVRRLPAENRDYSARLWKALSRQARDAAEANSDAPADSPANLADVDTLTSNLEFEFAKQ